MNNQSILGLTAAIVCAVLGLILAGISGIVLLVSSLFHEHAQATTHWPTAQGVIEKSNVTEHRDDGSTLYSADVEYRYTVAGREHTANQVSIVHYQSSSKSTHQEIIDRYPQGSAVEVYYNPEHPADALLEPGAGSVSSTIVTVSKTLMYIGLAMILMPIIAYAFSYTRGPQPAHDPLDFASAAPDSPQDLTTTLPWTGGRAHDS